MNGLVSIDAVCDYVIAQVIDAGERLTVLKLQKLMYYVQAWHLALHGKPLFDGKFQAWVHGPVNRHLYDRFAASKTLYADFMKDDIPNLDFADQLPREAIAHIDAVLEEYAAYTGTQLEDMTHQEDPWIDARKGYRESERCEKEISEKLMEKYYAARL